MEKELGTQNVNDRYLAKSCSDGTERIVSFENNSPLKLPPERLERRKQFWADFFVKYTNESLAENETLLNDSCASRTHRKSLSFIQHWINTGTLPYKSMQDIDKQSEQYHAKETSESSSSSSVDTAAYILSNMNTTNKVDAMAILEGAKHSALLNVECQDLESMETIKLNEDEMYRTRCGNGNSVQHNNESNSSMMPLSETENVVIFERSVDPKEDATQTQKHLHAHTNDITASKSTYNKLFTETLMHLISKTTQNCSLHTEINELSQTYTTEDNSTSPNNSTKLSQRKKLYSGRDSPVDILFTNPRSTQIIPNSKRYLHPALDTEHNVSRNSKLLIKRRARRMNMYRMSFASHSMLSLASKNTRKKTYKRKNSSKGTVLNVNGVKTQETKPTCIEANNTVIEQKNRNMDSSLIISNRSEFGDSVKSANEFKKPDSTVTIFKKPKLIADSRKVSRSDLSKHKKLDEVTTLQNLNPVVCLTKLSEIEIEKYKKLKTLINNLSNPVVHLNQLSKSDIQKYKKADKVVRNVEKTMTNPTVRLTRLLERDIKTIVSDTNQSELKENNLLSETSRMQKNGTSITKNTSHSQDILNNLLQNNNIINLAEDSDSNQSTLLIHECENPNSKKLTGNLKSASNVPLTNKLKTTDNKIRKNNTIVSLNNATDKHPDNGIRETRNSQRNKGIKPNNENRCGLSISKSNKTNNINNNNNHNNIDCIEIINGMPEVSICSYKHNNRFHPDEVEVMYENNCKRTRKPKCDKKHNFLMLRDDSDEFIKLIPKDRPKTFRNSLETDTSDTEASCNTVTRAPRSQRSPMLRQSSVKCTFRDWNFRSRSMEVISQKQKNANVGKTNKRLDINYLHFRTRFDTDSETSSCS
ncbi:uncharacterized protein LOC143216707 [Lasioglossum baleicum]|uniref:uncharacterized protein LOC143216707 n=1 Tax=Lasioglossum baleicum TaxID=434251 RepID=UPI003FCD44AA